MHSTSTFFLLNTISCTLLYTTSLHRIYVWFKLKADLKYVIINTVQQCISLILLFFFNFSLKYWTQYLAPCSTRHLCTGTTWKVKSRLERCHYKHCTAMRSTATFSAHYNTVFYTASRQKNLKLFSSYQFVLLYTKLTMTDDGGLACFQLQKAFAKSKIRSSFFTETVVTILTGTTSLRQS